jgi:hypothetical protein
LSSIKYLNEIYNEEYVHGSNLYTKAVTEAKTQADESWAKYLNKLADKGYEPNTVPHYARKNIRQEVRSAGVPVSNNWHPCDRHGFYNSEIKKVESEAKERFDGQIDNIVGFKSSLTPGLPWSKFISTKAVQEIWRSKLNMPNKVLLTDTMSPAKFEQSAYLPMIDNVTKTTLQRLHLSIGHFQNNGKYRQLGEDAYRSAIVAPIALGFSMIGGFVHIVKLLNFTILYWIPYSRMRKVRSVVVLATLLVLIAYPITIKTDITSSRLVSNLMNQASGSFLAKTRSGGLVWIIKTQTIFYPVNDKVRKNLLGGFDFRI